MCKRRGTTETLRLQAKKGRQVTNYAPGSETDMTRAVAMRMDIYNMLKLCTLPELEIIRESLVEKQDNGNEN
jgi:hypothetical protein